VHQIRFRPGLCPEPRWRSLQRSPDPLPGLRGPTSKGKEGTEKEGRGEMGRGRGGTRNGGNGREGVGMPGKRERRGGKGRRRR